MMGSLHSTSVQSHLHTGTGYWFSSIKSIYSLCTHTYKCLMHSGWDCHILSHAQPGRLLWAPPWWGMGLMLSCSWRTRLIVPPRSTFCLLDVNSAFSRCFSHHILLSLWQRGQEETFQELTPCLDLYFDIFWRKKGQKATKLEHM